ncbi:MAG TPA: hypothetical protein VLE49_05475 [Anaerolineales bacterium]|nr:hypothetical protein [Anaerolineales bacterium]
MIPKKPEDLSVQEIRFPLVAKRRTWRRSRIEHFYRTGRVFPLASDRDIVPNLHKELSAPSAKHSHADVSQRTWLDYLLLGVELLIIVGIVAVAASPGPNQDNIFMVALPHQRVLA